MKHGTMQLLFSKIADKLYRNPVQAVRSSGAPIYPALRLAMTVRYLAGGSYLDLTVLYGVSVPGFFQSLWMVCEALVEVLPIRFDMREPNLRSIASGFIRRQRKVAFHYAIGALDGMLVKIRRPSKKEFAKPVQMWCRKGYYGLNVQAMCDARRIFHFVAIDCPASVHDSVAFS
eukprot:1296618-Rhodomonas_salina.1